MSGWSDNFTCPNCGSNNTRSSGDYKPIDSVSGECFDCGFYYFTQSGYFNLEELNDLRVEMDQEPLTTLPEQIEI